MNPELAIMLLALKPMRAAASRKMEMTEEEIVGSYSATATSASVWGAGNVRELRDRIAAVLADEDSFEENESKPSDDTVCTMLQILGDIGECVTGGEVSTWYGELAVTWRLGSRMLRLAVFSDGREPLLYFQTDSGEALTRGQTIRPVASADLKERVHWLMQLGHGDALAAG
ncbi:MAG TPA: hypothetical protein VMR62_28030 [Bryobacteraceae bacterium]|jgi:hypothetical protein|nr:hypothetical protein [Bryobacteraceae bacterium]